MSSIVVSGDTSGAITIAAPAVSGTNTLTLPAATTTLVGLTTTDTLTNKTLTSPTLTSPTIDSAVFATVSGTAPIYPCRAWVNFNGTGTVAIRASGNTSSITDNGTGDYTVNFTNALTDANYSVVTNATTFSTTYAGFACPFRNASTGAYTAPTTSAVRINSMPHDDYSAADNQAITVAVFR